MFSRSKGGHQSGGWGARYSGDFLDRALGIHIIALIPLREPLGRTSHRIHAGCSHGMASPFSTGPLERGRGSAAKPKTLIRRAVVNWTLEPCQACPADCPVD